MHGGFKSYCVKCLFFAAVAFVSTDLFALTRSTPIRYYGYDWLDSELAGRDPNAALNAISIDGFSRTNLNVVHTIKSLNSEACAQGRCALGVQAGSSGDVWLDICPGTSSNADCQASGSWSRIWSIVQQISTAINKPSAIYFIDEPFDNHALADNGVYVRYQYSSYVCTLREALHHYGFDVPIYTVLSYNQARTASYVSEIQNQMPSSGCPSGVRSNPDWIGVDNYNWSGTDMWRTYSSLAPQINPSSPKWILVPPATSELKLGDQQLHDQIQLYWDFLFQYPSAPVVMIMNWRFDPAVLKADGAYPKSRALLSYMANTITP